MALLRRFTRVLKDRQRVHGEVECGYSTFHQDGQKYLQLDTYGSPGRKIPGKTSQSIQLDAESAARLRELLRQEFPQLP